MLHPAHNDVRALAMKPVPICRATGFSILEARSRLSIITYEDYGVVPAQDTRFLADTVITVKPSNKVTLVVKADYGT